MTDPEWKRILIVEAAIGVFASKGYHSTKMQDIADAVQLAKGTLYEYYVDKEDLFLAVYDHWMSKYEQSMILAVEEHIDPVSKADALIDTVRTALESFRQLSASEPVFNPASADRKFRICMTDASHITLLPQLLSHVRALAPNVRLDASRIDAGMPLALQTGDADIAIGLVPQLEAGFYQQTLFTQDWVCLANKKHPRMRKTLTLKQYKEEAHILIAAGTGAMLQSEALKRQKINRRVLLELPGFLGLPAILATTDLIVTLPRHIGETLARLGRLKVFECPVNIPSFQVKQHWHARYHNDPANRWLRGLCADLFLNSRVENS
ncbi:MAG: TetR family transcriptional regulator [Flavobacteriia bacterium]|nr:TetR family transcriptional regulator [Flavobacteriia bacterium]